MGALKNYSDYSWYDPPLDLMPDNFALIIYDGPPGDGRGGRYGLAPILAKRLKPGCVILLDDAAREQETEIAVRWSVELCARYETVWVRKPFIRMTLLDKREEDPGLLKGRAIGGS